MDDPAISIAQQLALIDGVVAVAQGGSSVRERVGADSDSDVDLYAFVRAPLSLSHRADLVRSLGVVESTSLAVDYWGASDQWRDLKSGRHIDLMYFEAAWMREEVENVIDRHRARLGYTTCFCYTMAGARALFDPQGWFDEIQRKCRGPYPAELRHSIVSSNHRAMRGTLSSYEVQVCKAMARNDQVSVNHRVAALLASYFDIIFAVNGQLHPGEKRLMSLVKLLCPARPPRMEQDVAAVLASCGGHDDVARAVGRLIDGLDGFLQDTAKPS